MDEELKTYLEGMVTEQSRFSAMENRLVEKMREMQTELLRGFEAFSAGRRIGFTIPERVEESPKAR